LYIEADKAILHLPACFLRDEAQQGHNKELQGDVQDRCA
jgi:hypothetical protein